LLLGFRRIKANSISSIYLNQFYIYNYKKSKNNNLILVLVLTYLLFDQEV